MALLEVHDYGLKGWGDGASPSARARNYCWELERGAIVFFSKPPFVFPEDDWTFLLSLKPADSRLHKNVSYRPAGDLWRGFEGRESKARLHEIMRGYAAEVRRFVAHFLAPYAEKFHMDQASFRPLEEEGRNLQLHKRNDLLHVDAFPSRPTRGGRIMRVFTNLNPVKARVWMVGEPFFRLAEQFAGKAGLKRYTVQPRLLRWLI